MIYIDYLTELMGGKVRPDDDVGEAVWIPRAALVDIWDELHEDTQKLLRLANIA